MLRGAECGWQLGLLATLGAVLLFSSGYLNADEVSCIPGGISFATQVDLDGDSSTEIIVGLEPASPDDGAWFCAPGDVYVYALSREARESWRYKQVFNARSTLPDEFLTYFFLPTLRMVRDIDSDSFPEVILVWLEENWWPTAVHPFAVLQFDQEQEIYEMAIDTAVKVSELGDFVLEDVDGDELIEIIQMDAVWGLGECHYCPHRYRIEVFQFDGEGFAYDPNCNDGQPFITKEKFEPSAVGNRIAEFLPQLMGYVYSFCITDD